MNLLEKVENLIKDSIIKKDKNIDIYRSIKAAILSNEKKSIKEKRFTEGEILNSLIKQREASITSFQGSNRKDLIEKEKIEIEVISSFLPKQKTSEEVLDIVSTICKENDFKDKKSFGQAMKIAKEKLGDEASPAAISLALNTLFS